MESIIPKRSKFTSIGKTRFERKVQEQNSMKTTNGNHKFSINRELMIYGKNSLINLMFKFILIR